MLISMKITPGRRVEAFVKLLLPYDIIEVARSGAVALPRSTVGGQPGDSYLADFWCCSFEERHGSHVRL